VAEILVVVEHRNLKLSDISFEMLSKGRQLAGQLESELVAVIIGRDIAKYAAEVANWADKVLVVKEDKMEGSLAEPYQEILSFIIKERKPRLILIGHSSFGMDLAPALAIDIGSPLASDCSDIFIDKGNIWVSRLIYNGKVKATYSFKPGDTVVVTGRPGVFAIEQGQRKGSIEEITSPLREEVEYKRFEGYIEPPETDEVDITKSSILVSVGRGIKDKENIKLAQELADAMGADLACSRPVSDNKWLSDAYHVGLSGKIVKPKLYLALGISGAFQHTVGIKGAETVIAVNKDAKAPIFAVSDYGVIDDLFKVVPALTQKIKEYQKG
jgi:electron transfer flavoprotein alpha subunit